MKTFFRQNCRLPKPETNSTRYRGYFSAYGRPVQGLSIAFVCVVLSACSVSSTLNSANVESQFTNNTVTQPLKQQGIESTDAEIIKALVADTEQAVNPAALAWQNPDTGNKGTITAINKFVSNDGQSCKKFQTTVDTFMGISLYNGETCELKKGFWVLSWLLRDET